MYQFLFPQSTALHRTALHGTLWSSLTNVTSDRISPAEHLTPLLLTLKQGISLLQHVVLVVTQYPNYTPTIPQQPLGRKNKTKKPTLCAPRVSKRVFVINTPTAVRIWPIKMRAQMGHMLISNFISVAAYSILHSIGVVTKREHPPTISSCVVQLIS